MKIPKCLRQKPGFLSAKKLTKDIYIVTEVDFIINKLENRLYILKARPNKSQYEIVGSAELIFKYPLLDYFKIKELKEKYKNLNIDTSVKFDDFSIYEEYRGLGYGTRLFKTALNYFDIPEIDAIESTVGFYEKFGFEKIGFKINSNSEQVIIIKMKRI